MPPDPRPVPRFAAEPPQEPLPYGRWAERLRGELLGAAAQLEDAPRLGDVAWYPDRSWHGRTWVPATAPAGEGLELVGFVSFRPGADGGEPTALSAGADLTDETAERHPEWRLDLNEEVVGSWRADRGRVASMTLVWGTPLVPGGAVAIADLGAVTVDQCTLVEGRFTLLAPDDLGGDLLEIALFNDRGEELARESLYED